MKITKIKAREVLDSRGNPTVEAEVFLNETVTGRAIVPSGASTGEREAVELRDNDAKRYNGKGVMQAVNNVNITIADEITDQEFEDQSSFDNKLLQLDGTE